jgi:hypothetical protein
MRYTIVKSHKRNCGSGKVRVVRSHRKVVGAGKAGLARNVLTNFVEGVGGKTAGDVAGTLMGGGSHAASLGKTAGSKLSPIVKGIGNLPVVKKATRTAAKDFMKSYPTLSGKLMDGKRYLKKLKISSL